jgi:TRAP-type mannitol/chloroaromatic compound transport system permease small subunit
VDWISVRMSQLAAWTCGGGLISAGNAFIRYGFDISSNGWLEIQWYLLPPP